MKETDQIDLQSLQFFLSLYKTGSLKASADAIGVSQPTAQRTLAKLRDYWNDPLFERHGFKMEPSARARRLQSTVADICSTLEKSRRYTVDQPEARTLKIGVYDTAVISMFARQFAEIHRRFPELHLRFFQQDERMFEELRNGFLDFVIYARQGLASDLHCLHIMTQSYVWVVRKGHPLEKIAARDGFVMRDQAGRYPFIQPNAQPNRKRESNGPAEGFFDHGHGEASVITPFFLTSPFFLEFSDHVTVLPKTTAEHILDRSRFSLLPVEPSAPNLVTYLAWHDRNHEDLLCREFRVLLRYLATQPVKQD